MNETKNEDDSGIETNVDEFGTNAAVRAIHIAKQGVKTPDMVLAQNRPPAAPDESKPAMPSSLSQWTSSGPDEFIACGDTRATLPAGAYSMDIDNGGRVHFCRRTLKVDDLIRFDDTAGDRILEEIEEFWKLRDTFKRWGFLHRRGYLTYGPAGSGKTSLIQQVIANLVKRDGIVLIAEAPFVLQQALITLRRVERDRPLVCLFEDLDAMIERFREPEILAILDGESQTDGVINLATTNYPENLDKRIICRPRRFDRVVKIDMPSERMRRQYFELKLQDRIPGEVDKYVAATHRFSFAAMAELIISVKCLQNSFESSIETLEKLMNSKPSSGDFNERAGFASQAGFAAGAALGGSIGKSLPDQGAERRK